MGLFSRFFSKFFNKRKMRLLCIGLDNSGKSSIVNWLKPKKASAIEVVPTIGFQVEEFTKNNVSFTVFDMSGQGKYRNMWEHYYEDTGAIIWVIDASDKFRIVVVKDELTSCLNHKSVKGRQIPILFFANKMDIPGALSPSDISKALELDKITDRQWYITQSNAVSGEGLEEGLQWLVDSMKV